MRRLLMVIAAASLALSGCAGNDNGNDNGDDAGADGPAEPTGSSATPSTGSEPDDGESATASDEGTSSEESAATSGGDAEGGEPVADFDTTEHGTFNEGWAMAFLPSTDYLAITERGGSIQLRDQNSGETREVSGVPNVNAAGQGGMHDIIPSPSFSSDDTVYLSWVRDHDEGAQGVVARATLDVDEAALSDVDIIWQQTPASGHGHFALRLFADDDYLYVTSGDRQEMDPAQDTSNNLGAVLRLTHDGDPAPDGPWDDVDNTAPGLWSIGHRNPLGIDRDGAGTIWVAEMGPKGGDELNRIVGGVNYGWPEASMGVHYDGTDIPDHADGDGFEPPAEFWVPAISPGSLEIYAGELFTGWQDSALLGGLSGQKLVRVELDGATAEAVDEWDMGERIRAVDEAPDGAIWVLEDGPQGRLVELRPAE